MGFFCLFVFLFVCLLLFRDALEAYGGSQVRGPIGATAASLRHSHSNTESKLVCGLHHSSQQHRILSPLSEASGVRFPAFKSQLYHLLATWTRENYVTSLCLSFLICKMRIK